jgi:glycosyltransferase involved in cell wall biosynthesis
MENNVASQSSRVLLVDHMCVLPYGHNLNGLVLFEQALRPFFGSSICLATRKLPDEAEQASSVDRVLSYPYDGLIEAPTTRASKNPRNTVAKDVSYFPLLKLLARRAFYTGLSIFFRYDYVRTRTRRDWRNVFKRYKVGPDDVIFFPSAEYYGCLSLLDVIRKLPLAQRPKVHFRMIGVMESANYSLESGRPHFVSEIRQALADKIHLSVSAETPPYCELLERLIGSPVTYMPYPLASNQEVTTWDSVKVVTSPGQGRIDKGFMRLYAIICGLQSKGALDRFYFDIQDMRRTDDQFRARYQSILKHVPNLILRPARLKQAEIDEIYRKSDILVLPYDAETYALRGSAVYQEGLAVGRPVVCSTGLGFSELVKKYGNGLLATSDIEFSDKILELAEWSKEDVEQRVSAARVLYQSDFELGLKAILESFHHDHA